ncbi:MAG: DUF2784 domain-containing protein, partial [Acidiferrobacterales bacterium]|nr:DUF2784 domain-containing protein [Acidiferrobacterales bacterium]
AAFALFAVFGAALVVLDPRIVVAHVPAAIWSSVVNLAQWTCPLTPLDRQLRIRAGQSTIEASWTQRYLEPLVRPLGMPRELELVAGISIVVWNTCVYAAIWYWGPWHRI